MRAFFALLVLSCFALLSQAEDPAPEAAVQKVITGQLTAFLNQDAQGAWQYAHPSIQAKFGNADTFMQMVSAGYSPMLNFVDLQFLTLEQEEGIWWQTVRLRDTSGERFDLLYALLPMGPDGYGIAGVSLTMNDGI